MYNAAIELLILKFWEKNKIFEKLIKKNKGKKRFSFLDGPITANNPMGIHHAWGRTYKDLYQRFRAMQGYDQRFQNGFDCQGLWIEREEEKDLGFKTKAEIEHFGILNFVERCKARAKRFAELMTEDSIRLGQWMDWENSYYTNSDNNNLHNWFLFKEYYKKKWLYKGKDVVPWCPRCGTASSKHDIITAGYKEVVHKALYMQFPVKGKKDEYFLIFTTTPWTVPANAALAVHPNLSYVKVKKEKKFYWLAETCVNALKEKCQVVEKKKGNELAGVTYVMPYSYLEAQKKVKSYSIMTSNLVSGEEGTGIVHIAPGCGPEDYELGQKEKLPALSPLNENGIYADGYDQLSEKGFKEVNEIVLADLEKRNFIYKTELYRHRYPHCFRCGAELVFRLVDEWYVKAEHIREKLKKENKKIKWFPNYGKKRQENWFDSMNDWLISRKRYYGLPLPFWECKCGFLEVIGSLDELRKKAIKGIEQLKELHRPWIDNVILKCPRCKKEMKRVSDVGDAWLDAGIVPFSTINYLKNKKEWKKWFPADFICENLPGQYRGWFNALFWASVTLTGKAPFKSVLGYESLKDKEGREMHKSLGNVIWAKEALEKIGADSFRLTFCLHDPASELRFDYNTSRESVHALNVLFNIKQLILEPFSLTKKIKCIEDRWILSKLNSLIEKVTTELEALHPHSATAELKKFWLESFSHNYIQSVRDRISKKDKEALSTIYHVYLTLLKLLAPTCPFITEAVYQELKQKFKLKEESVHLCAWPNADKKLIDKKLEQQFSLSLEIIEKALALRAKAGIGIRWPLSKLIASSPTKLSKNLQEIIARQLNVKKVEMIKSKVKALEVELDTKITKELEAEGYAREIIRAVQDSRKEAGLKKEQAIALAIACGKEIQGYAKKHESFIKKRVNASTFAVEEKIKKYQHSYTKKIKEKPVEIAFSVV